MLHLDFGCFCFLRDCFIFFDNINVAAAFSQLLAFFVLKFVEFFPNLVSCDPVLLFVSTVLVSFMSVFFVSSMFLALCSSVLFPRDFILLSSG